MKKIVGAFLLFTSSCLLFFILYGQYSSQNIQEEMMKAIKTKYEKDMKVVESTEKVINEIEIEQIMDVFNPSEESENESKDIEKSERERVINNALAILSIPSIKLKVAISEGVIDENLKYSVAHYAHSATFGDIGNACVVGHRSHKYNRFFYKLDKVKIGDNINIDTGNEVITYKVSDIFVVEPKDVWVLESTANSSEITLITCTPIKVHSHRLIIKGKLCES